MSLWETCLWTLLRTSLLVALALLLCYPLRTLVSRTRGWPRRIAWTVVLAPLLAPHLVTGYGYANFSLSLLHWPAWNEVFYGLLLLICIVPVGVVLLYFAPPPPVTDEALHCRRLAGTSREPKLSGFSHWMRGSMRRAIPAFALMFLVAFQEFELASLMGVTSWSVWLFDAQAGGLVLSESLRYVCLPFVCQLIILIPACTLSWNSLRMPAQCRDSYRPLSPFVGRAMWVYLLVSFVVFCVVPWALVLGSAALGISSLIQDFTLAGDIVAGCVFAITAGVLAYLCARWFLRPSAMLIGRSTSRVEETKSRRGHNLFVRRPWKAIVQSWSNVFVPRAVLGTLLSVPGLLGPLVLGLSVLSVFQLPRLAVAYDTPLPWLMGLVLFLLPRAVIVLLLLAAVRSRESQHLAQLLHTSPLAKQRNQARELQWHTSWAMHFWVLVLLCYWAYVDLTAAALLSPTTLVSAPVRLYNLMHYGQSAVLSAMVLAAFGIPAMLVGLLAALRRPLLRLVAE